MNINKVNRLMRDEAEKLLFIFDKNNLSLSTAESCSGGLISTTLTSISGASSVYMGGIIAYDNKVKNKILGIPKNILDMSGAVSSDVAEAMSENTIKMFKTDFSLSVTGIAGPNGGSKIKPVGTIWVGISYLVKKNIITESNLFCFGQKSREHIRALTCYETIKLINSIVLNNK